MYCNKKYFPNEFKKIQEFTQTHKNNGRNKKKLSIKCDTYD